MNVDLRQAALANFVRDGQEMKKAVDALLQHAEAMYGLFHDAAQGWYRLNQELEQCVTREISRGMTRDQALNAPLVHGEGTPETGRWLHKSTLRERIAACSVSGQNEVTLGSLCVVSIYAFWEDRTRGDIANALRIGANDVQSDLFGDLAKFRNSILHAGGKIDGSRARAIRVLKWFQAGDTIIVDRERLHQIIRLIRAFPEGLRTIGYDPLQGNGQQRF